MPPIAGSLTLALKAIRETNILYTNIYVFVRGGGKDGSGGEGEEELRKGRRRGRERTKALGELKSSGLYCRCTCGIISKNTTTKTITANACTHACPLLWNFEQYGCNRVQTMCRSHPPLPHPLILKGKQ